MTKNVFFCSSPVCKWIITIVNFLNMFQTVCIWDIPGQKDETWTWTITSWICTELRYHNIEFRCLGDRPWGLLSDLSRGINGTHPPKKNNLNTKWFMNVSYGLLIFCLSEGVPSGKHTKNYGKLPFSMGKSTISTINGPFSIAILT